MKKIQLSIPEPCHENWEAMTPGEKGRFCGSCQKTVVDFSGMSDRQIAEFFKKPAGSVCGRFYNDQLDRDISIPKKRIPWLRYFFQFALPAFVLFLKSCTSKERTSGVVKVAAIQKSKTSKTPVLGIISPPDISPVNPDTLNIPIKHQNLNSVVSPKAAEDSVVSKLPLLSTSQTDPSYKFMDTVLVSTSIFSNCRIMQMGAVSGVSVSDLESKKEKDSSFLGGIFGKGDSFSVYPNPARNNSIITIEPARLKEGDYVLALFDTQGALIKTKMVSIQKHRVIDFGIGNVASAQYLICLRNSTTGKQYTKKIIVQ
jgi:hypothetical protein